MSLHSLIDEIVRTHQKDPRNKVFVSEPVLLASVAEEVGVQISSAKLIELIENYQNGSLDDESEELYDGAIYACSEVARRCFGDDPDDEDEEVDHEVSWIENEDGSYAAEVRPY